MEMESQFAEPIAERWRAKPAVPLMADLPQGRLQLFKPAPAVPPAARLIKLSIPDTDKTTSSPPDEVEFDPANSGAAVLKDCHLWT